jgi:hypothetical protein
LSGTYGHTARYGDPMNDLSNSHMYWWWRP